MKKNGNKLMKTTVTTKTINDLPQDDIMADILSRLPGDSAIQCRRVCKTWQSIIDHPTFVETHTSQFTSSSFNQRNNYLISSNTMAAAPSSSDPSFSSILCTYDHEKTSENHSNIRLEFVEYNDVDDMKFRFKSQKRKDKFKLRNTLRRKPVNHLPPFPWQFYYNHDRRQGSVLISSCNGLVFIASTKPINNVIDTFVYNPFTREYVNLVSTVVPSDGLGNFMAYGFGYSSCTKEYKVVSIYYEISNALRGGQVSVYTLGSGTGWRSKGDIPHLLRYNYRPGLLANGALHWMDKDKKNIVSFDLGTEKFRVVPISLPAPPAPNHIDEVGVLGGCLCITRSDKTICESPKDIWVLNIIHKEQQLLLEEDQEDNHEYYYSWNKIYSIPWKSVTSMKQAEPQVCLRSGKILLNGDWGLVSYDPKTKDFNEERFFVSRRRYKIIPYRKSLVSLKALGEENTKFLRPMMEIVKETRSNRVTRSELGQGKDSPSSETRDIGMKDVICEGDAYTLINQINENSPQDDMFTKAAIRDSIYLMNKLVGPVQSTGIFF